MPGIPIIHRVGHTRDRLGESPLWDAAAGRLLWLDSLAGLVRRLDPSTGEAEAFAVPAPVGSLALCEDGRALLALQHAVALFDFGTGRLTPLAATGIDHPDVRLNDGKVDRAGRFVVGTMHPDRAEGEAPLGGLYRLEGGVLALLETGIAVANGPCFSPDGRTFYYTDSPRRQIYACDYGGDRPGPRRILVETGPWNSSADGATVDSEGFLWTALVRAGAIARFDPRGRLDRLIAMPVRHPTSVMFGGAGLDMLYVTSLSRSARLEDGSPQAGGLFAIEVLGVHGLPEPRARIDAAGTGHPGMIDTHRAGL